jgi:thiol-disulfide isomerase/thioredoxin
MSGLATTLKNLDQFRVVSRDLTRNTLTGGIFTAVAYAALVLLLIAELSAFFRTTYSTNVVMDENNEESININFDILVQDLPCKYLKLFTYDKFGGEKMTQSESFQYIPVDHSGSFKGMTYTKEEIAVLEQAEAAPEASKEEVKELDADWSSSDDHFKHHDFKKAVTFHDFTLVNFYAEWCGHCRQFFPTWAATQKEVSEVMEFETSSGSKTTVKFLRMNCVDFGQVCQEVMIQAFPSIRLYKKDGTFESFNQKRNKENIISWLTNAIKNSHLIVAKHHAMFNEGCQVKGQLAVPRVPGHFHLQAEAFGNVNVNPALTNVSHIVNHLSFGEREDKQWAERNKVPKDLVNHIAPLDGKRFIVERFHQAPQHYLKIVTTKIEGRSKAFYQMTHTDTVRKLSNKLLTAAPQARFSYDFSPMSVVVKTKSKRWYEFLTSLFAILGGTYTIVELCSGAVDTVSTAVKDAMGKNN